MTRDEHCKLLEENGWTIICKDPFEIEKYENGILVAIATGQAAFTIAYYLEKDNKLPKEILLDDLKERYKERLTVGKLQELISEYNLPKEGKVLIERIEDRYYERNGWGVVFKKGEHWDYCNTFNKKILSGEFLDKKEYPNIKAENLKPYNEELLKLSMDQYHPAWYACKFDDDDTNLYICLHY